MTGASLAVAAMPATATLSAQSLDPGDPRFLRRSLNEQPYRLWCRGSSAIGEDPGTPPAAVAVRACAAARGIFLRRSDYA